MNTICRLLAYTFQISGEGNYSYVILTQANMVSTLSRVLCAVIFISTNQANMVSVLPSPPRGAPCPGQSPPEMSMGIHYRGVQSEGAAVDGGSIT